MSSAEYFSSDVREFHTTNTSYGGGSSFGVSSPSSNRHVKWSENNYEIDVPDFDSDLDKDVTLYSMEKSHSRTSRRIKDDVVDSFNYNDWAMIPPTASRSPITKRKFDRAPSPTIDPRSPSPVHQLTLPPKTMEVRTPSPKDKIEDHTNCKYHSHHLDYKYTPPPVKGPCVGCGQYIVGPLVTALDEMWHPECFTCVNCDTILKANNYAVEGGKQYCKPCHEKLFGPQCSKCHKPTRDNRLFVLNRIWHPECFCCVECNKKLSPDDFIERLGSPYCPNCYHRLFSPKCCACGLPIKDKAINALNKMWHTHCFKCTACGIPLEERNFYEKDGRPYCEHDYKRLFCPPCTGCKKPITDGRMIQAMGKPWHPECFTCTICVKPLSPDSFFEHGGKPYCEDDYHKLFSPKCAGCLLPIKDDNKVVGRGRPWHSQCFAALHNPLAEPVPVVEPVIEKVLKTGEPLQAFAPPVRIEPNCNGCKTPVSDANKIVAMGKPWHPQCFTCTQCHIPLSPTNFYEKNGKPYCENDYHKLFSPKCAECLGPITDGNVVKAMGKNYHPQCFKCTQCAVPLDPNNFYEKNGKPYCEDDYHKLFSPKCAGCHKPIKDNNFVNAIGKNWHPQCFKCTECKKQLDPYHFYEHNGLPYCERDYHLKFSPKCAGCALPITTEPIVNAMGKQWHPACFNCTECHKVLTPPYFKEKGGKPYCEDDYNRLFRDKCAGCEKPILGNKVTAMGKNWHPECFNCHKCHKQLRPDNFFEKGGKPYCEDDYYKLFAPKCNACNLPIKDKPLEAMGRQWHPHCFKCSAPECGIQLSPNNFMEKDGKPYCRQHYNELFMPKCYACKRPITDKLVNALGKKWHPECFACVQCHKPLQPDNFREKDGLPYCEADYLALFAPKCAACHAPIVDKCLTAMGKTWHPEHFVCHHCNKVMSDDPEGYHEHDGKGYCRPCYIELFAPYCRGCNKPIIDKFCVTALDSKWHEDCFVCRDCHCPLKTGNYFEFEGEPYCEEHYRCKMCPDCIKLRRAQNKYFGQSQGSDMSRANSLIKLGA